MSKLQTYCLDERFRELSLVTLVWLKANDYKDTNVIPLARCMVIRWAYSPIRVSLPQGGHSEKTEYVFVRIYMLFRAN
ncbi:hypothetical protein CUMW_225960 [Citrus unshiu]|uniref:Uncharacterized protein n=1 Tax=Citrus unshiu TaxID=55188 RepID=A0A2H5QFR7_CITUN|nr:hypothetical protein CUMW_225960 [Citrus unshiu]